MNKLLMKDNFYEYVISEVKIPCSSHINISKIDIDENDFVNYLTENKYSLDLINFLKETDYQINNIQKKIDDQITYHYKINNQLYFEYNVCKRDSDKYVIVDITAYSSKLNMSELVRFLDVIDKYIQNK
jgi:hypothetical protein